MGTRQQHKNGPVDLYPKSHDLQAAAVKSSLLSFRCRNHLEQGSSQNKSNSSSLSERKMRKEGRKKTYFIFCTADRFYLMADYAIYRGRDCEAGVHRERALSLALLQCVLSDVWGGKVIATACTAPLSGLSTPTPGYPELWRREVKCFHMRSVFVLVAYKEESR